MTLLYPPSDAVQAIISDDGSDQPTAGRTVDHGEYDTTSLTPGQYQYAVHRDWIGHWTRWAWAGRQLKKGMRVLEPGCGPESMLLRHIQTNSSIIPSLYVGVDLNRIKFETDRRKKVAEGKDRTCKWADLWPETNFVTDLDKLIDTYGTANFDRICSFEVYEHITPEIGLEYLQACRRMLADDGELLLSTPVFNGKKAANHVREYTVDELATILDDRGFEVVDRFGTFASVHDVRRGIREMIEDPAVADGVLEVYERCREFLSDGLLAGMLSPIVPDHSRNCTWRLRKKS
jgi:SAM-dependent methyltransferase